MSYVANSIVSSAMSRPAKRSSTAAFNRAWICPQPVAPTARLGNAIAVPRRQEQQRRSRRTAKARVLSLRACRSLGGCVTSTAWSGPPVRPAEHAGRGRPRQARRRGSRYVVTGLCRLRVLWTNADDRLPVAPLGRVEGGDGI